MKTTKQIIDPTTIKLTVEVDEKFLSDIKSQTISRLSNNLKVPGFRPGKVPVSVAEKNIDQNALQAEFLDQAINSSMDQVVRTEKIRIFKSPEVNITKFVPYTTLEYTATIETITEVKIADYKSVKLPINEASVSEKEIDGVVENLRERAAAKKDVQRSIKLGDETVIDFKGQNAKTKENISGADGSDYPLIVGSNSFIPGFETALIGLNVGDEKTFNLTFPSDYGVSILQGIEVIFTVNVKSVKELVKPKLDDKFLSQVGPFKTLNELRSDIKKQLLIEKQKTADQDYLNQLLTEIADKSTITVPKSLVESEITQMEEEEKRNLIYRGQTWEEHLIQEGVTEQEHRDRQIPIATSRIKSGIILSEIAESEKITVTRAELDKRLAALKKQYTDEKMIEELSEPRNQQDILNRMLIEKTLEYLKKSAAS